MNHFEVAIIGMIISSATAAAVKLWHGKQKMNAKELRTLAAGLNQQARINIQRGMAPLQNHTGMNPDAPFARAPQALPAAPRVSVWPSSTATEIVRQPALKPLVSSFNPVPQLQPASRDPQPPAEGTFFWPGLAEKEINAERMKKDG